MEDARKFLTPEEKTEVEEAIAKAETETSAEIVCAVATESGRYERAEGLAGVFGSLLGLGALHVVYNLGGQPEAAQWSVTTPAGIGWQCLAVVLGFIVGNVTAAYWHGLRRLFTSRADMEAEVTRAANYVYRANSMSSTDNRGAVLLYLSLYERRLFVIADQGACESGGKDLADNIRDIAQSELRAGHKRDAMVKAIEAATERLKEKLPVRPDEKNQISDELLIIHPRP